MTIGRRKHGEGGATEVDRAYRDVDGASKMGRGRRDGSWGVSRVVSRGWAPRWDSPL